MKHLLILALLPFALCAQTQTTPVKAPPKKSAKVSVSLAQPPAKTVPAPMKMGYVNMSKVFTEYYKTVRTDVTFEQKKLEFYERMNLLRADVEAAAREVRKAEEEAKNELLSRSAREEAMGRYRIRFEDFVSKRDKFERQRQQSVAELERLRAEVVAKLGKELLDFVTKYAKERRYTHIYDVSGLTMNRMPALLVYPVDQEITKQIILGLNKGHEKELDEAKIRLEALRKKTEEKSPSAQKK